MSQYRFRSANVGLRWAAGLFALVVVAACDDTEAEKPAPAVELTGEQLFSQNLAGGNGRSCATCHVPEDNFTSEPERCALLKAMFAHGEVVQTAFP